MSLIHPDNWIWDFWFATDPPDYHVFFLQAPRSLRDESKRHFHVSIGHAVSQDLQQWQILPDALHPAADKQSAWDNYTTWTGSILQHEGRWYLFYTGGSRNEQGLIQRIGLATSSDLINWTRHPDNPILELDTRWYETLDLSHWHDQAWRDPWVFKHSQENRFHMLITARANYGNFDGRGVIGQAVSEDLLEWEVLPPLTEPGFFGHMEVPQMIRYDQQNYLLFSTPGSCFSAQSLEHPGLPPQTGTFYLTTDSKKPSFRGHLAHPLLADQQGTFYSAKLIQTLYGEWKCLAVKAFGKDGTFNGSLTDPLSVTFSRDGRIRIQTTLDD
ncbi:MAG: family 43 glycosylhydrolase [Anaerolineales bacterium]|nr:family 43 glycosylhydrolase [Anaerolineales bacterium]